MTPKRPWNRSGCTCECDGGPRTGGRTIAVMPSPGGIAFLIENGQAPPTTRSFTKNHAHVQGAACEAMDKEEPRLPSGFGVCVPGYEVERSLAAVATGRFSSHGRSHRAVVGLCPRAPILGRSRPATGDRAMQHAALRHRHLISMGCVAERVRGGSCC